MKESDSTIDPEWQGGRRGSRPRQTSATQFPEARRELIELCVRVTNPLGLSRSVGEIFGLVFSAAEPVSFDDVVNHLGISAGSASQGLRLLRRMGAVRVVYIACDRRDFYTSEVSLRKLLSGYLGEAVLLQLSGLGERLWNIETTLQEHGQAESEELREKIMLLRDWHRQIREAMSAALEKLA